ncbi:MAG TPA: AAC(3) family N-acetyltransferase [Planctomycetota bacterium]|nr:AAC(3) family N-acetyltransferase [Planctomycetota bacterium]
MTDDSAVPNRTTLTADLRRLGVGPGDALFIHSALSALGLPRGPESDPDRSLAELLGALCDAVGSEGLVAVPTFSNTYKAKADGPAGLVWNPKTTPSRVGSFTNYVLRSPGAARSDHPTHSVAAVGTGAAEFCAGHSWREDATPFDRRGPWGRLAERGGKILWLGTDMRTQTAAHVVEDWMALPYMPTAIAMVDDGGRTREIPVPRAPAGPRDFYKQNSKVERAWNASGRGRRGLVGRAECQLMGADEFIDWLWAELLREPALLLSDDPADAWSAEARAATAAHLRNFRGDWRRAGHGNRRCTQMNFDKGI